LTPTGAPALSGHPSSNRLPPLGAARFSISWGRIIPSGRKGGAINQKGVDYYNSVIDEMIKNGVSPAATLYHWDLPQANQDAYKVGRLGGWERGRGPAGPWPRGTSSQAVGKY
jgi:hypothetical protein